MTDSDQQALTRLTAAGYFAHLPDGQASRAVLEDIAQRGLYAALFDYGPATGRYVPLDAEDLADGGAGMGIQQVKLLFDQRGIALDAADSDGYDEEENLTYLTVNGNRLTLCKWSWGTAAHTDSVHEATREPALQDLLHKFKAQGIDLQVARPADAKSESVDLFMAWGDERRLLQRWRFGTEDGWILYSVGFFSIVNRLLEESGSSERLYAHRPFTNDQAGMLLTSELHALLTDLGLAQDLRRIDTMRD